MPVTHTNTLFSRVPLGEQYNDFFHKRFDQIESRLLSFVVLFVVELFMLEEEILCI